MSERLEPTSGLDQSAIVAANLASALHFDGQLHDDFVAAFDREVGSLEAPNQITILYAAQIIITAANRHEPVVAEPAARPQATISPIVPEIARHVALGKVVVTATEKLPRILKPEAAPVSRATEFFSNFFGDTDKLKQLTAPQTERLLESLIELYLPLNSRQSSAQQQAQRLRAAVHKNLSDEQVAAVLGAGNTSRAVLQGRARVITIIKKQYDPLYLEGVLASALLDRSGEGIVIGIEVAVPEESPQPIITVPGLEEPVKQMPEPLEIEQRPVLRSEDLRQALQYLTDPENERNTLSDALIESIIERMLSYQQHGDQTLTAAESQVLRAITAHGAEQGRKPVGRYFASTFARQKLDDSGLDFDTALCQAFQKLDYVAAAAISTAPVTKEADTVIVATPKPQAPPVRVPTPMPEAQPTIATIEQFEPTGPVGIALSKFPDSLLSVQEKKILHEHLTGSTRKFTPRQRELALKHLDASFHQLWPRKYPINPVDSMLILKLVGRPDNGIAPLNRRELDAWRNGMVRQRQMPEQLTTDMMLTSFFERMIERFRTISPTWISH